MEKYTIVYNQNRKCYFVINMLNGYCHLETENKATADKKLETLRIDEALLSV